MTAYGRKHPLKTPCLEFEHWRSSGCEMRRALWVGGGVLRLPRSGFHFARMGVRQTIRVLGSGYQRFYGTKCLIEVILLVL